MFRTLASGLALGALLGSAAFAATIEHTLTQGSICGVICKPHSAMGMVMTIAVRDVRPPADFLAGRVPRNG